MKRNRITRNSERCTQMSLTLGLLFGVGVLSLWGWSVKASSARAGATAARSATSALVNTLTVTNTADGTGLGPAGSLRRAINNALAGDTITFAIPTTDPGYNATTGVFLIRLTAGQLVVHKSLTINGPGADELTISGNSAGRVFRIGPGSLEVTLADLTIAQGRIVGANAPAGGSPSAGQGGGIYSDSTGALTLSSVTLVDNVAIGGNGASQSIGAAGQGGAIFNNSGALNISNAKFTNNGVAGGSGGNSSDFLRRGGQGGSGQGGAIFNNGSGGVTVTGSVFDGNTALGGNGGTGNLPANGGFGGLGQGGGIYLHNGSLSVTDSRLKNVARGGDGGDAQANCGGTARPTSGHGGSGEGGGIYATNARPVTVSNSHISDHLAIGGRSGDKLGSCSLFNYGAPGRGDGGGIYYSGAGALQVTGSTFANNEVNFGYGGGILNYQGTVTVRNSTFANNEASSGGGLANWGGTLNLEGSTVSGNEASDGPPENYGGGIFTEGALNLTNSTLSGNRADGTGYASGGGLFILDGPVTLLSVTIAGNSSNGQSSVGGGLANPNRADVSVRNTIIARNTVSGEPGSAQGPDVGGRFDFFESPPEYISGRLTSQGYNLIGNNSGANITPATGDQIGTASAPVNPLLGPLADNGGPTQTRALLAGSPAIDKGNSFGLTTDQRGYRRPYNSGLMPAPGGDRADIGAFELQPPCPTITFTPTSVPGGILGASYYQALTAMGGTSPYQFAVSSGSLPAGLTLSTDGVLSGLLQPSGTFTFTITATDNAGCTGNHSYSLTITCLTVTASLGGGGTIRPGDSATLTVTFAGGAVPYSATLSNGGGTQTGNDPVLNFTVTPAMTTTYTIASATEGNGCPVTAEGNATVTISNDTTPPTITCPSAQTTVIAGTSGVVNYPAPSVNDNYPGATFACNPPSGANFALGTTTVNCTATDAARNTATCSFTVSVRQPRPATKDLIAKLRALVPPLTQAQANGLIGHLELANTNLERGQRAQACTHLQNFINAVNALVSDGPLTADQGQPLIDYADLIRTALGCG